jgi:UDP-N-acetylmuramate--alanine ligase
MNLNEIKQAYFLGIGGIGMSAIARYFHSMGIQVSGYDKTETTLTKALISEGIDIHYQDLGGDISKVVSEKETCLIVLTPAIPQNHLEWKWLSENKYTILKRAQVLGLITDAYRTIGVAGTHGKTTTSSLLAHILKQSTIDCAAFLGGISTNYETNLLLNQQTKLDAQDQMMVVEADEFDRSFLTLHPEIAIITSTDADHLDIYGEHEALKKSFTAYAHQARKYIVVKKELELNQELIQDIKPPVQILNYSIEQHADFYADNIRIENGHTRIT